MSEVTAIFWDIGGVLLTNAWDRAGRSRAVEHFGLDRDAYAERHGLIRAAFETGQIDLDRYLDRTVFYEERSFTRDDFTAFMFAQSEPLPGGLALVDRLVRRHRWLIATINNESTALNQHRIDRFDLRRYFTAFFSSCYLGVEKPDETMYLRALQMTQRSPGESVFIDDRALNVERARRVGMVGIQYHDAGQLERDLRSNGIEAAV